MLSRIDHVNIVVTDLESMVQFYSTLLGLTVTKRVTISGEWVSAVTALKDVNADVVYLELPGDPPPDLSEPKPRRASSPRIELIRYRSPATARPQNQDRPNAPGLRHLAFAVTDIDPLVQRLRERGVKFFSEVFTVPEAQVTYSGGVRKRIVYFQDPEGNLLELCEYR